MQIGEHDQAPAVHPLWRLAFRAGFLCAALFAVLSMLRWLNWMLSPQSWHSAVSPNWWHAHEMVFGFAMPVVAGFLLTAVANWTGTAGTRGIRLQWLFGLWLTARLVLWLTPELKLLAWAAEMAFICLLGWELTTRVWPRRQWRNMLFTPLLLVLMALDTASFLQWDNTLLTTQLHYGAVWMITAFIVIIGGRVTPLFTANRLGLKIAPLPNGFEYSCIAITVVIGLRIALLPSTGSSPVWTALFLLGAAMHSYRLWHWQGWKTGAEPLLWSMHLAYLCIPLSMLLLALAGNDLIAIKNATHLLAIGTIGGMILAMMSRVTLGHTGRQLAVPVFMAIAFATVFCAALVRALLPQLAPQATAIAWEISAVLWIVAFALFLWHFAPMLYRARVDGKPG